ncbi:hypothetical protein B1F69_04240 [Pseudomonas syringae]|uniref:shufflon system plasmid conjugative transfer pilus tip adhesin PilV n=1 Tax=Pseudomonas syringae TaxID=317 RepID=UPI0010128374|nr:shufflon system plasmid conjugative transfer pilus tip adhesin PilV [Pseudomonas syringae]RXU01292.1 hypothetical protein B1F69_04240 [Pseudomonas syringae]
MKRLPTVRLPPRCRQTGFLLVQAALVVLVLSIAMAYAGNLYWQGSLNQGRDDKAKLIGERMASVSDATKTYATTFFTQIQRGETVTRNGYSVAPQRLLAPTLTDLSGLGFLPVTATNPVVYNGQSIQYNVSMQVNTQSGCTIPTCSLLFQVTTSAPLLIPNGNTVDIRRATIAATAASPGNAGVSMPSSMGGNPSVFVGNGGTVTGINNGGVAGLVSISNGYDSQGFFEFLRRDGSLPMTGTLNMQDSSGIKHDIANANDIDAVDVTASGDITAVGAVIGKTVTSTGRLRSGEFLQLDGIATENSACSPNGLVGRNTAGLTLSCQSGLWKRLFKASYVGTTVGFISNQYGEPTNCETQAGGQTTVNYWLSCGSRACTALGYTSGYVAERSGPNWSDRADLACF